MTRFRDALQSLLKAVGVAFAASASASDLESAVLAMDACLRASDPRIANVRAHQFVVVSDSSKWKARGKASAAAWTAPDGRQFTVLHVPRLKQLLNEAGGGDKLNGVLVHEYAHHITGKPDGNRKLQQCEESLRRTTAQCRDRAIFGEKSGGGGVDCSF